MLDENAPQNTEHDGNANAGQTVHDAIGALRARMIGLITEWSHPKERYADLRSRTLTREAHLLIFRIGDDIAELESKLGKRVRKRRVKSGVKFLEAIERFVGDLLRVRAGTTGPARIFRSLGKTTFDRAPVKYDVFTSVLEGLKALELVGHQKGRTSYLKIEFDPGDPTPHTRGQDEPLCFWATGKLLRLARSLRHQQWHRGQTLHP